MNSQEIIQPTETSFHMKSQRFYCTPCNRQFSFLNPENGRATCPRCENVSTRRVVESETQNQSRSSNSTTNSSARRQTSTQSQSNSQQRQSGPYRQPSMRQRIFSNQPGIFMQTAMPGVYFIPQHEQGFLQQYGYNPLADMLGLGDMFGMSQNNMFSNVYAGGGYRQPSTQYYQVSPFDLFGGLNEGMQRYSGPMYMMGDQMITPEEYERLVEEFIQSDPNNYGPAPASEESLRKLREFEYSASACKNSDCSVCQDTYKLSDKCIELPCRHNYHKDCVLEWLTRHDSCPICRKPCNAASASSNRMEEEIMC